MSEGMKQQDFFSVNKQFQDMFEKNTSAWIDSFVKSESYAAGMGLALNNYLSLIENWKKNMAKQYSNLNLVSQEDFTRLSRQIIDLETKVDDIQSLLEEIQEGLNKPKGRNK